MDDILGNIILGILGGVLASWLFWHYILSKKPRIAISPYISAVKVASTGETKYRVKIVNMGSNQITNISINAWVVYLQPVPGGDISHTLYPLETQKSETLTLNPKGNSDRPWGLTPEMTMTLSTTNDLLSDLQDSGRKIMVTIKCSDAISGSTLVVQKVFTASSIQRGLFEFGASLEVEAL